MLTCTARSIVTGNGIPEFCYDNTIADISINGGYHKKDDIDAHFDMFSWKGLLTAMSLSYLYGGVTNAFIYFLEMYQFIGWYGIDSDMAAGSAVFLFGGFDF